MTIHSVQGNPQLSHSSSEMARQCPVQKVSHNTFGVSSHRAVNHLPRHREHVPDKKVLGDFTAKGSDPRQFLQLMAFISHNGSPQTENHSVDEGSRRSRKPVMAGQQSHAGCKSNFDDTVAREKRAPHETKPEKRERKAIEKQDARDKKEQARSEAKLKQEGARQALHEARCEQSRGKVEPESNYSRHQEDLPLSRKEIDHVSRRYTHHQPFHTSGAKNAGERRFTALQAYSHHSGAPLARENSINHHNSRVSQQKELNELMNEGLGEWSLERSHSNYNCGLSYDTETETETETDIETDIEKDIETDTLWESQVAEECEDYRNSQSLADTTEREFLAEFEKDLTDLESSNDWHDSQEFQSEADLISEGSSDISEVDVSEKGEGAFFFLDIYESQKRRGIRD